MPATSWIVPLAAGILTGAAGFLAGARRRKSYGAELEETRAELTRRLNELFSIQELAYVISESTELEWVAGEVTRYVSRSLESDGIALVLQESEAARICAAEGVFEAASRTALDDESLEFIRNSTLDSDIEVMPGPVELFGVSIETAVIAPLRAHDACAGALIIARQSDHPFSPDELRFFGTVAAHASVAIVNARFVEIIRRGKEDWETTFDSLKDGVALVDTDGLIRRANRSFGLMVGAPVPDTIGQPICETLLGMRMELEEYFSAIRAGRELEPTTRQAPDDGRVYRISAARIGQGEHEGWIVAMIEDVTKQTAFESRLIQNEKMVAVGQLVSGVAHELNNPLTSIAGLTEFLMDQGTPDDPNNEHLEVIHEQAERAGQIVRNLLTFARKGPPEVTELDLNTLIQRTLQLITYETKLRDIELTADLDPDLPPVAGDRYELQQIIVNLLTNAVQAVDQNAPGDPRRVHVLSSANDDEVVVVVSDTGPGIPEANLNEVFTPFFTTKETGSGTGLGLAISYAIIESHHGSITARNRTEGPGAVFEIRLPRAPRTAPQPPPTSEPAATPPATTATPPRNARILLVDDDPAVRRMITVLFSSKAHQVDAVNDGAAAMRMLQEHEYDLIIANPRAAVSAGEMLAPAMLSRWPQFRKKTILISGDVRPENREWLEDLGCTFYLKPFKISDLRRSAGSILDSGIPAEHGR